MRRKAAKVKKEKISTMEIPSILKQSGYPQD